MNRLLELHGNEKEFSQGRLKDQDGDFEKELRSIRVSRAAFSHRHFGFFFPNSLLFPRLCVIRPNAKPHGGRQDLVATLHLSLR